jgi:CRP/FNR family nitrogen fixation transcriptional regulator
MSASMMQERKGGPALARPPQTARPEVQPVLSFAPDETIFREGGEARWMYKLVDGLVRGCRFHADGRRQIEAFHKPGDVFGFEPGLEYGLSAEAVTACTVLRLARPDLARDPHAAVRLCGYAMRALADAQAHARLLGRGSAGQRLAGFLLDLQAEPGQELMELPMTRQDIADYLGLTIETISRTLGQFVRQGMLHLITARKLRILDREGLAALCG